MSVKSKAGCFGRLQDRAGLLPAEQQSYPLKSTRALSARNSKSNLDQQVLLWQKIESTGRSAVKSSYGWRRKRIVANRSRHHSFRGY
jgi:hypothetical protein